MSQQRFFSVVDGDKEVAHLVTGAALEWNEHRSKRSVYQVTPDGSGGLCRFGRSRFRNFLMLVSLRESL